MNEELERLKERNALLEQGALDHDYLRDRGDLLIYRDEYERLVAAEAQLAEAREVLEEIERVSRGGRAEPPLIVPRPELVQINHIAREALAAGDET